MNLLQTVRATLICGATLLIIWTIVSILHYFDIADSPIMYILWPLTYLAILPLYLLLPWLIFRTVQHIWRRKRARNQNH